MTHGFVYKSCKEKASPFTSLRSWRLGHQSSYLSASKHQIHHEIARDLGWRIHTKIWDYAKTLTRAKDFDSLKAWSRECKDGSYTAAVRHKWQAVIGKELGWSMRDHQKRYHWSYEKCLEEASKYSSMVEWSKGSSGCHQSARGQGWHLEIAEKLGWKAKRVQAGHWTYEACFADAQRFTSSNEWRINGAASYAGAVRKRWTRAISKELGWVVKRRKGSWTYEACLKEASKYSSMTEWRKYSTSSYQMAGQRRKEIGSKLGWA